MLFAQGTPARIVAVSSRAHEMGAIDLQDLHFRHRAYTSWGAYGEHRMPHSEEQLVFQNILLLPLGSALALDACLWVLLCILAEDSASVWDTHNGATIALGYGGAL